MKLHRIGVELELNVGSYGNYFDSVSAGFLRDKNISCSTTSRGNIQMSDFHTLSGGIMAQLTDEYYSSQCEWKIFPETLDRVSNIQGFIKDVIENTPCKTYHAALPSFVGTHIHLFFKEKKKDLTHFTRGKTILSAFLMEYFYYFFQEVNVGSNIVLLSKELERLCFNHNILQKLDYKLLSKGIRGNLNDKGFDYYYTNIPKDKYQPVHWSNPSGGKPLTLELRYIPNAFFQFASLDMIQQFLKAVENKVTWVNSLTPYEFAVEHDKNIRQCIYWHSKLLEKYLSIASPSMVASLPRASASRTSVFNPNSNEWNIESTYQYEMMNNSRFRGSKKFHKKILKYVLNNLQNNLSSKIENKSFRFSSIDELVSMLNIVYFPNKQVAIDKFYQYIETKVQTFETQSIAKITQIYKVKPTDVPCRIDGEGYEIVTHDAVEESSARSERDSELASLGEIPSVSFTPNNNNTWLPNFEELEATIRRMSTEQTIRRMQQRTTVDSAQQNGPF